MVIATWNVNSIRARLDHVVRYWEDRRPDVLCLQELKVEDRAFPRGPFEDRGLHLAVAGERAYNGVAIVARRPLENVVVGFPHLPREHPLNAQRRLIGATVQGVRVYSVYVPNGEAVGSPGFGYKLAFLGELRALFDREHQPSEAVVVAGDFNVAPEPRDVYDPAAWEGRVLFSEPERRALEAVRAFGFTDCFRRHHPEPGRYSWWDYRRGAFWKNQGLRIDHVWATGPVAARCRASDIDVSPRRWKRPSDHAPVWAAFDL